MNVFFWFIVRIISQTDLLLLQIYTINFSSKLVSGEPLDGVSRRVASSMYTFFSYNVRLFSQTDSLFLQIYAHNFSSNLVCIWRTARQAVPSCHLLHGHVLFIQGFNVHEDKFICSQDSHSNFFWISSVSGHPLVGGFRRATFSMDMFIWYNVRNISQADLLFLQIYTLKVYSNIVCIRRTARPGIPSCHLLHGHVLLIQCSKYQPDGSAVFPDIPTYIFFENHLYQEIIWTVGTVVPSLTWACSPDTRF